MEGGKASKDNCRALQMHAQGILFEIRGTLRFSVAASRRSVSMEILLRFAKREYVRGKYTFGREGSWNRGNFLETHRREHGLLVDRLLRNMSPIIARDSRERSETVTGKSREARSRSLRFEIERDRS